MKYRFVVAGLLLLSLLVGAPAFAGGSVSVVYLEVSDLPAQAVVHEADISYLVRSFTKTTATLTEAHDYARSILVDGLTVGTEGSAAVIPPRFILYTYITEIVARPAAEK